MMRNPSDYFINLSWDIYVGAATLCLINTDRGSPRAWICFILIHLVLVPLAIATVISTGIVLHVIVEKGVPKSIRTRLDIPFPPGARICAEIGGLTALLTPLVMLCTLLVILSIHILICSLDTFGRAAEYLAGPLQRLWTYVVGLPTSSTSDAIALRAEIAELRTQVARLERALNERQDRDQPPAYQQ